MIEFLHELREWAMLVFEGYICYILTMEYFYDRDKDLEKKHKKTRTTKKTTNKAGESIVEESTETFEPISENKHERNESKV